MGWTYPYGASRKGLIAERTKGWEVTRDDDVVIKSICLAQCFRGAITHSGVLWSVFEQTFTNPDGSEFAPTQRFIACDLMECNSYNGVRSWGYKDMDESMGPHYYNCPEKYLKMVPEVANQEWRAGVAEYHTKRREKLAARKATEREWMQQNLTPVQIEKCNKFSFSS